MRNYSTFLWIMRILTEINNLSRSRSREYLPKYRGISFPLQLNTLLRRLPPHSFRPTPFNTNLQSRSLFLNLTDFWILFSRLRGNPRGESNWTPSSRPITSSLNRSSLSLKARGSKAVIVTRALRRGKPASGSRTGGRSASLTDSRAESSGTGRSFSEKWSIRWIGRTPARGISIAKATSTWGSSAVGAATSKSGSTGPRRVRTSPTSSTSDPST